MSLTDGFPSIERLAGAVLHLWPEHERFLRTRFSGDDHAWSERLSGLVLRLVGDDLPRFVSDYRWMCERVLEEELHFRREGRYRLSSFEEARREVYDDHEFMTRYMNGLLLSQVLWANHAAVMEYYADVFLPSTPPACRHLEIGPGHGLLLYFAAENPRATTLTGWDLSRASLDATRATLDALQPRHSVTLSERDLFAPAGEGEPFDTVVLSEVCEHLEDPAAALSSIRRFVAPERGRLFVNVPVNSPAPDHLYLLETPEEAVELVEKSGYEVVETRFFPATGQSIERARKARLTISCVVVARLQR